MHRTHVAKYKADKWKLASDASDALLGKLTDGVATDVAGKLLQSMAAITEFVADVPYSDVFGAGKLFSWNYLVKDKVGLKLGMDFYHVVNTLGFINIGPQMCIHEDISEKKYTATVAAEELPALLAYFGKVGQAASPPKLDAR